MDQEPVNPFASPRESGSPIDRGPANYVDVPWYRRSENCSRVVFAHVIVLLLSGCVPFVGLLGIFTMTGVMAVCIVALTGPIYYARQTSDGTLATWGVANKVAAVILLVIFLAIYGGLFFLLLKR